MHLSLTRASIAIALLVARAAPEGITWQKDVDATFAAAKEKKQVVLLAVNMDGERACERLATKVYRDKEIVALSSTTLNLVASANVHASGEKPCPRFGSTPCAAHGKVDIWARTKLLKPDAGGYVVAPQHVFLDPEGKVILSVPYEIGADELAWCFATAQRTLDPSAKMPPAGTHAPRRLILGGVYKPATEQSATPATRDEALALIKEIKKGPGRDRRLELLNRITSSDEPECIDYLRTELRASGQIGGGGGGDQRAEILRSIGALAPPSYWELVTEFSVGGENSIRQLAAVALEQLAAPASLKKVQTAYAKEDHREIKKDWIRALAAVGANDAGTRKEVLELARKEKDELLRLNAIVALGSLAPHADVAAALSEILEKGSSAEKRAAACAMALTRDPQWLQVLDAQSSATDEPVKVACAAAAKSLRNGGLLAIRAVLLDVTKDTIERDRWFAGS